MTNKVFIGFGNWLAHFLEVGTLKSFSVLLNYIVRDLESTTGRVGMFIGMHHAVNMMSGVIAKELLRRYSPRSLAVIGGITASLGLMACSQVNNDIYFAICLIFSGLGMSFTYIPNAVSLVYAYKDQYMLPLSVGSMGAGMGMMILPLLTQKLLEAYSWRGTVLVIGALYLHIVVCGTCLDPTTLNSGKTSPPTSHDSSTKPSSVKSPEDDDDSNSMLFRCSHKASDLIRTACREAGLHVFSEYPLIIYAFLAACLNGISYSGWTVFVISNAESKGAAEAVAVLLSLVSGIANTAGRLMPGLFNFLNKDVFSSTILFILFGIIGALPLCMNRISTNFSTLCVFAAISGFALGAKSVLKNTNALDVVPRYLSSTALPFTFISAGLGEIAGGWITGLIFDVTGSMDMAFLFLGCVDIFCVIVLTLSILHGKIISSK
ncbi:monocarboxylate transporter 12-like [Lytechinus pictus]|uniref:monocarboxylate transporter 12-like n=1 Tax=Lytechinus pictus TaxID=7653 RepID=UPI0030B9E40B